MTKLQHIINVALRNSNSPTKMDLGRKSDNFSKFYTKHLSRIRYKRINILEIGAALGASAASFVHYFKKSKVFCIDVNLTLVAYESKNIKFFGLDSSNSKMLNKFIKKISQSIFFCRQCIKK